MKHEAGSPAVAALFVEMEPTVFAAAGAADVFATPAAVWAAGEFAAGSPAVVVSSTVALAP
eukprot:11168311-Lingulodinium_polyedra.AAC.1